MFIETKAHYGNSNVQLTFYNSCNSSIKFTLFRKLID